MDTARFSFKLFANTTDFDVESVVPVFHSWIQNHSIPDHLLIDVADYSHVHDGPGIVLISHEANFSLDRRGGRLGLTYQRKQPLNGSDVERMKAAFGAAVQAAKLLGSHVQFRSDEIEFRICDRLHAPNTAATFDSIKPLLLELFPAAVLTHKPDDQELFTVLIKPSKALS